jgi:hypothetical protein
MQFAILIFYFERGIINISNEREVIKMTIVEFYEWAKENGVENYEIGNYYYNGYGQMDIGDYEIDHKLKRVTTEFEC